MNRIDCTQWTPEQIRSVVLKDILDRDQTTFVKIRRHDRIGWESEIPQGGNYSDYINNETDPVQVLRQSYSLASSVVAAMDTPYRVHLKINNEGRSATDSVNVWLATDVFDDKDLTLGQKLDTFLGLAVHESCHLKWTDFDYMKNSPDNKVELIHNLHNILEDERIERLCGEETPGYANFLIATKYYTFDKYERDMTEHMKKQGRDINDLPLYAKAINAILHKVRYPHSLSEQDISDFGEMLVNVSHILRAYPESTAQTFDRAKEIYELIVDEYAKEINKEEQQQQQNQQGQPSPQDGQPGQSQQGDGGTDSGKAQAQAGVDDVSSGGSGADSGNQNPNNDGKEQTQTSGKDQDGQQNPNGKDQAAGGGRSLDDPFLRNEAKKKLEADINGNKSLADKIRELIGQLMSGSENSINKGDSRAPLKEGDMCNTVKMDTDLAREIEGEIENITSHITIERRPNDINEYRNSYRRIQKYINPVAKALKLHDKDYDERVTGLRSGRLDMNKIVDIYAGSQTIYTRKVKTTVERACVCVLIDESGSMNGERCRMARDTGVLLTEALKKINNLDLYIYGFDNCGGKVRLYTYKEKGFNNLYALGSVNASGGTPTGEAVAAITERIRKLTQEKCLMFVATDGEPNSTATLEKAKEYANKNNVTTFGVGIRCSVPKAGFNYGIQIHDLEDMARLFAKEVKNASVKNTRSRTI